MREQTSGVPAEKNSSRTRPQGSKRDGMSPKSAPRLASAPSEKRVRVRVRVRARARVRVSVRF